MVDCLQCNENDGYHNIEDIQYNTHVKVGERYTIVVYTSRKWYSSSSYQRVCLWEGQNQIAESGSIKLGRDEVIKTVFTGTMPNRDMHMNVSLQNEAFGMLEGCEDGRNFIIYLGQTTEQIPDVGKPWVPPTPNDNGDSTSEPWIPPWESAEDTMDSLTTTIIIGVIGAVIIAIILKRK